MTAKRRPVLFIDSWTQGKHMFLPVADYLRERNIPSLLVHYGSWDAEPGRPREEYIQGLLVRDISYYRTRFLHTVFERERPACVVTLTTNNIIDRAKVLGARALRIPTVFLMHGILAVTREAVEQQAGVLKTTLRRRRFSKIPKHLSYIGPNYLYSGAAGESVFPFSLRPYRVLLRTFLSPERWKMYPEPSPELQCDLCLAWGEVYKDFLCATYGYKPRSVLVMGHPPLDKACRMLTAPPSDAEVRAFQREHGIDPSPGIVLYIEGAFAYSGYEGWTMESLAEHLLEVSSICDRVGRRLVVKLHPSTTRVHWLKETLRGRAVIVQSADPEMLIWMAESVIGHSSTLINSAIVLGKPVFIPRWGISAAIPGNFDHEAPVVSCCNPDALTQGLAQPGAIGREMADLRAEYLRRYLAPLDGNAQNRIGAAIAALALAAES